MFKELAPRSLVYEYKNALPKELRDVMIAMYEESPFKVPGLIGAGIENQDIKSSLDLRITGREDWSSVDAALFFSVINHVMPFLEQELPWLYDFANKDLGYQIQKTEPGQGYKYHYDSDVRIQSLDEIRNLVLIWYLNDVDEGGETEFQLQGIKVKPEQGKLIIFPPYWTHLHRGNPPISNTKYICTTWMCA